MRSRLFHGVFGCLALLGAGCASSAIETDDNAASDPNLPDDGELDAGLVDSGIVTGRDGATAKDGGRTSDAGSAIGSDAGRSLDSGASKDAAGATPVKDAAVVDAAAPVDSGPQPQQLVCSGSTGTACSGQCVDLRSDGSNCGNCGHACTATQTCNNSMCVSPMQPTQVPAGCSAKTYQNHTYAFCTQTRNWNDARSSCLGANLDLTIVADKAESDFVKGNGDSWIGETDLDKEGTYVDVVPGNAQRTDGAAASYENWQNGNPNNTQTCDGINIFVGCLGKKSDEDCLEIGSDGQWNDDLCTRTKNYVCESY
ncbi:MAG: C-type lectin domain family 10 er A-like isoform [Myxococcaceae bacterium]|nr:C-type lectin domain family 10 er A-like isoform [Myxococcaceae bacterium]